MALNPSRLGQDLGAGSETANFIEVFGGEILSTFLERNQFMELTKTQTIDMGASASFPVLGTATAKWHTAGEDVILDQDADGPTDYSNKILGTTKDISVDKPLVSPVLIPDVDRFMNHFDYRSDYIDVIAHSLAKAADEHILASILAAARASESITGITGRPTIAADANFKTVASNLFAGIYDAAAAFDAVNIPKDDRFVALAPAQYYMLAADTTLVQRTVKDYGQDFGKGEILQVAGMTLVNTNNMPLGSNLSAVPDSGSRNDVFGASGIGYNGDWTSVAALCFHKSAVGTVKLADLTIENDRKIERQSELIVASYVMGHSYLRPESAIELKIA